MTAPALRLGRVRAPRCCRRVPLRPLGRGRDDFGGIAVYLASPASAYHTGDTFVIDGGYLVF